MDFRALFCAVIVCGGMAHASTSRNDIQDACEGRRSCFSALNGEARGLCEAYKEGRSCFSALNGENRGWCEVIKEGGSCFVALDGVARQRCEIGDYPRKHRFWARCGDHSLPPPERSTPIHDACEGRRSCFSALNGEERGLCEAYKEGRSCFSALNGENRGWCEVIKEGRSCFVALDGVARQRCEAKRYPSRHRFWANCSNTELPKVN